MSSYETVPVILRQYHVGSYELRVHCRKDNSNEVVQGWLYHGGVLTDTILTTDKKKSSKLALWFLQAAN